MTLTRNKYAQLGKAFIKAHPQLAAAIMQDISKDKCSPLFTDCTLIAFFWRDYFRAEECKTRTDVINKRLCFIATIVMLYDPLLLKSYNVVKMRPNIRKALSSALSCNPSWISQKLSEISVSLKVYEDFRQDVDALVEAIKAKQSGNIITKGDSYLLPQVN